MQFLPLLCAAFALAGAAAGPVQDGPVQDGMNARVARWREDLGVLAKELPARHKNLFFELPKEEFEAAVAELDAAIPKLCDDEIVVELMRLVASVGDGHTSLQQGASAVPWSRLPLRLRKFSDGLRVVAIGRDHREALGGELVSVGGVAAGTAWQRVAEVVSHENDAALCAFAPQRLETPFVLHGLRLAEDASHASFEVKGGDGAKVAFDLTLATSPVDALGLLQAQPKEPPLWLSRPGKTYWFEYVAASKLLFFQYNSCRDDPAQTFAAFCTELWKCAEEHEVDRVVVDLRQNGGGNSAVIAPLYMGLASHRKLREKGRLFVAIGPSTFSSAMMNAIEMKNGYGAILVGEPTGGKPNAYGEVKVFELPRSRLSVQYSTKYFELVEGDPRSVVPDLSAPLSWSDWSSGRDPVVEAVLATKPASPAPPKKE